MNVPYKFLTLALSGALILGAQSAGAGQLNPGDLFNNDGGGQFSILETDGDEVLLTQNNDPTNGQRTHVIDKVLVTGTDDLVTMNFTGDQTGQGTIDNVFAEVITNESAGTWTTWFVEIIGDAVFAGTPVLDAPPGGGTVNQTATLLTITDILIGPGDAFDLTYFVDAFGDVTIVQGVERPQQVPEPGSIALLGLGLAGLGLLWRRQRRKHDA